MKIGIISDLHLIYDRLTLQTDWDFLPESDIFYICAGDVCENEIVRNRFIDRHLDHMLYIKGNHDYYDQSFASAKNHAFIRTVNGVKIAAATLWTDLSLLNDWYIYSKYLIDARCIKDLTYDNMVETHETHKQFLLNSEADIIVSHHCPSRMSIHDKYKNSQANCCFMTDLTDHILNMKVKPKLWIHGHTHESFDYMIGDTRVICHPRGYRGENSWHSTYLPKIIEIKG